MVILFVVSVIVIPQIPNSYSHAFVTKSEPNDRQSLSTAPSKVNVWLIDPVDIKYSGIRVLDSDGNEVQLDDLHYIDGDEQTLSVSLPADLPNGIYTVSTKMLDQTDGHLTENAFVFAVGQAVPQNVEQPSNVNKYEVVSIPEAIARFPALVGQVMVVGVIFSTLWLWRPLSKLSRVKSIIAEARTKIDSSMIRLALIGSIIILGANVAMIVVQAYTIDASILDAIQTKFGNIWAVRMGLSSALFGLVLAIYLKQKNTPVVLPNSHLFSMLGLGFAVMATTTMISHGAATGEISGTMLDFAHNVFSSLWIGGLIYFAFVAKPQLKKITDDKLSLSLISVLIPRFTVLVVAILGAVVITGPFLLFLLEQNISLTFASFYGKALIVKLVLAAAMIALGGYDHVDIRRRSFMAISKAERDPALLSNTVNAKQILSKFHTSVRISMILGIALLAAVAVLVDSGLPSSEFQNQLLDQKNDAFAIPLNPPQDIFTQVQFIEDGSRAVLTIDPFHTGNNNVKISFLDSNKNPIDLKSVQLQLSQIDSGIGPITIDADKISTGMFNAQTSFGFPGNWHVRVEGIPNKENALSLVASYNLFLKPSLNSLSLDIKEFKTPENSTRPFYTLYDKSRNTVWTGDNAIGSSRILEYGLDSGKYTTHNLEGLNAISLLALDSQNKVWYIDPITKVLGSFNPDDNSNTKFGIKTDATLTALAIDANDTVWITATSPAGDEDQVFKFDSKTAKFSSIKLPNKSGPLGMTVDNSEGKLWIAYGTSGKIASLDISNSKISEFSPIKENYTLLSPTALLVDDKTGKIIISEHDGTAVSVYDPLLDSFKRVSLNPSGLPYGMAFDKYHNLWVAQHVIDKIAVVDLRTGSMIEKETPTKNTYVQWLTADSDGNIIIAEWSANALGKISISALPSQNQIEGQQSNQGIPDIGFSYAQIVAPSMTALLAVVGVMYARGAVYLHEGLTEIKRLYE
ncbi:MAG TPA: copper resistance protein CopC [Candidatus Nitrosotenuis sp.]|nr:copper resistance protein CopC [Candidatus Nitrosotenuis sp.]